MRIIALLGFIAILLTSVAQAQEPKDVTLVQLIATPEKFDGKLVRVIGFLRLEFEGNVLYLHREDYENAILGNGIWVDVYSSPQVAKKKLDLNMNYVLLEGVFSSNERGHMGMWSGTIHKIRRADPWRAAKRDQSSPNTRK
jgi:hypothetical protein